MNLQKIKQGNIIKKMNGFSLNIYGDDLWYTISSLYDTIYYKLVNNNYGFI